MNRLFNRWKLYRKKKNRIKELKASTRAAFMTQHDPDPEIDAEIYFRITKHDQNELDRLLQAPLVKMASRWGLDIPPEYWDFDERLKGRTLSETGKNWIRREAGKRRREWAKDWIAIVSPVMSALIAILGLLVALKSGHK